MIKELYIIVLILFLTACGSGSSQSAKDILATTNNPPTANAGIDQSVNEKATVVLSGSGVDTDGSLDNYTWNQVAGVNINLNGSDTMSASFDAPATAEILILTFQFTVTDNDGATASDTVDITINPIDGWTIPIPVAYDTSTYDLTDHRQPGSRLFYISNEGSDPSGNESPTGQIYFWDGIQIVDATGSSTAVDGTPYGTDPMHPTGAIKPYKRWVYVAPRRTDFGVSNSKVGAEWGGADYAAPGRGDFRAGFPDWWMFKRGNTFDLQAEYLSFAQETNPSLTETSGGSITIPGGSSANEIQVVGAYGDLAHVRPRFINPNSGTFLDAVFGPIKHAAYLSLHFDGRGTNNATANGVRFRYQPNTSINILLEDLWLEALGGSFIEESGLEITLRRVLITDAFNKVEEKQHVQGLYTNGTRDARIRIEESILMRNGFKHGDPELSWPPSGDQTWDVFDRNMYLSGECDNDICGVFDTVSMIGASGDQFRPGMRLERNFFYQGYIQMGASGGYPDSEGPTGTMLDNVLQRFKGTGTNDDRGQPGWGMLLGSGAYKVEVARNIVTSAQYPASTPGFSLDNLTWYCYSHNFNYATRENNIHDNIFDSGSASSAIQIIDGGGNQAGYDCGPPPGVAGTTGNYIVNNILINANWTESEYLWVPDSTPIPNDTYFADNAMYSDILTAAASHDWNDPDRTLKSYLESIGVTVTSDDGFIEYFNEAKNQRRGYWREEYTAKPLVSYIRAGFGMDAL